MNKNAQTGKNNTKVLKWYKALILAIAATLTFHYQPTIEAMDNTSSSQTNELTSKELENTLLTYTQVLAKYLDIEITKDENSTNWLCRSLSAFFSPTTKTDKSQAELQNEISKKIETEAISLPNDPEQCTTLLYELIRNAKQVNTLLELKNNNKYKQQLTDLQQSYQKALQKSLSTNINIALNYLTEPSVTIDPEEYDQEPTQSNEQNEINNQPTEADITNITRLATLYLATMLYIDIERPHPNASQQTNSTNENYPEKIKQHQQQIKDELTRYITKTEPADNHLSQQNQTTYKSTTLLQQEIEQRIAILQTANKDPDNTSILVKQITTLHIILKLLFNMYQQATTELKQSIQPNIQQYQEALRAIAPRKADLIAKIIIEATNKRFATISFSTEENKQIHQLNKGQIRSLKKTLINSLNQYMGLDSTTNIIELLQDKKNKLKTNASGKKDDKQPLSTEQNITAPTTQHIKPIIAQLKAITHKRPNYLGIYCTIPIFTNQLETITEQYEETEKNNKENPASKLDQKTKLAKQAIETIINFLTFMISTAATKKNKTAFTHLVEAYTNIRTLLRQQEQEREKKEKEAADKERLTTQKITHNLSETTKMIQNILEMLYKIRQK